MNWHVFLTDSFAELSGGRTQEARAAPPRFDLSNMSDDAEGKEWVHAAGLYLARISCHRFDLGDDEGETMMMKVRW